MQAATDLWVRNHRSNPIARVFTPLALLMTLGVSGLLAPANTARAQPTPTLTCSDTAGSYFDLSGGNFDSTKVYTSPNGVRVTSSAPTYVNQDNPTLYYLAYLFNGTTGANLRDHWLTNSSGQQTLTVEFPFSVPLEKVRVYPTNFFQNDRNSKYKLEVKKGELWVDITGGFVNTLGKPASYFEDHTIVDIESVRELRFTLTRERSYGSTLTEIQFFPRDCSGPCPGCTPCETGGTDVTIDTPCYFTGDTHNFSGTLTIAAPVELRSIEGLAPVELVADDIVVTSSGRLDGSGLGFGALKGEGFTATPESGSAHGGFGGGTSGTVYGSILEPTTLGSGSIGNRGGAALVLRALGSVIVDGEVRVDGQGSTGTCDFDGAAGGSVYILADAFGGSGLVSARGGTACTGRRSGGGGRIAVDVRGLTPNQAVLESISAAGGAGALAGGPGSVLLLAGGVNIDTLHFPNDGILNASPAGLNGELDDPRLAEVMLRVDPMVTVTRLGLDPLVVDSLVIKGGGTLSHFSNDSLTAAEALARKKSHVLNIKTRMFTVESGGAINVDGKGYAPERGPGGAGTAAGDGGSFGGAGGRRSVPGTYGDLESPDDLGSGGDGSTTAGGHGGGLVKLSVDGAFRNDGIVSANGRGGTTAAGGSGGSVQIVANVIEGAGQVLARGGTVTSSANPPPAGGGGGRIALIFKENRSAMVPPPTQPSTARLSASGGGSRTHSGSPGTTFIEDLEDVGASHRMLIIDNASHETSMTVSGVLLPFRTTPLTLPDLTMQSRFSVNELVLRGRGSLEVPNGVTLEVPDGGFIRTVEAAAEARPNLLVASGGSLVLPPEFVIRHMNLAVTGSLSGVDLIRVMDGHWLHEVAAPTQLDSVIIGANGTLELGGLIEFEVAKDLTVLSGGTITHRANYITPPVNPAATPPPIRHKLRVRANKIEIASGGKIDVTARGYSANAGPGRGTKGTTSGGGGHGGAGGKGSSNTSGGVANGSAELADSVGSGGGEDNVADNPLLPTRGAGGGSLQLFGCESVDVSGDIIADGNLAQPGDGGGGAGGGIRIVTHLLSGQGRITANGGAGHFNQETNGGGGGGGGGRIYLSYAEKTFSGPITAIGGAKGANAATNGQDGSLLEVPNTPTSCGDRSCGFGACAGTVDADGNCDLGAADGQPCSDGNMCTSGDVCEKGSCVSGPSRACEDGNPCSEETCDETVGCIYSARSGSCEEGSACTVGDTCDGLVCKPGAALGCDDGNQCTLDFCDSKDGCRHDNLISSCDDGDDCTGPDLCGAGKCEGARLEIPGCYGAFAGPPVIGPAFEDIVLRDGSTFVIDLTERENDFEDGSGDGNGLTWRTEYDPGLFIVEFDPLTEVLKLTPRSMDFPIPAGGATITFTLSDSDGNTDTQTVDVIHQVSDYLLTVEFDPNPALPNWSKVAIKATLKSPTGRVLERRAIRFTLVEGDGQIFTVNALTDASGIAKTFLYTGSAIPHVVRAEHRGLVDTFVGEATLVVGYPEFDAAINVLDISFWNLDNTQIVPGDVDPLRAGTRIELRANVRNLGSMPAPPLDVRFRHTVIATRTTNLLGTARTSEISVGSSETAAFQAAFAEEGVHLLEVIVDPDNALVEFSESNNIARQIFYVGPFGGPVEGGGADSEIVVPVDPGNIEAVCSVTGGTLSPSNIIGIEPAGVLSLSGRADYSLLIPSDPDRSLGLAAVSGGIVRLKMVDDSGNDVEVRRGANVLIPADGNQPRYSGLTTMSTAVDLRDIGEFPSRIPDDTWDVVVPDDPGCYTLETCVSDGNIEGCCPTVAFCVSPDGPNLSCTEPATPQTGGFSSPLKVGVETKLETLVTNDGDFDATEISAQLLVDGVAVGSPVALNPLAPLAGVDARFPWVPGCGPQLATIQLTWTYDFIGIKEVRTASCATRMPDISASRIDVRAVDRCDYELEVRKSLNQTPMLPASETGALFTVVKPDSTSETRQGSVGLMTSTAPFNFTQPGTYEISALVDVPIAVPELCGTSPEKDELGNNLVTREVCADPSPSDDPRGGSADTLSIVPWPVIYGEPATVTAEIFNHGRIPITVPFDVRLSSSRGPLLETDKDNDLVRVDASCDTPIMPGESRQVEWEWTPRYPTDGSPELRDLRVVAEVSTLFPVCDGGVSNDWVERRYGMNLFHTLATSQVMQLGETLDFDLAIMNSGGLRPNDEGSLVHFEVFRTGGERLHEANGPIIAPGDATSPDRHTFSWTPSASDCRPQLPMLYVHTEVDENGVYAESNENDNEKILHLPDLVPTDLSQTTVGCESRVTLTVEDNSPSPRIAPGIWNGTITIVGPDNDTTIIPLTGMSGDGVFDITALTGERFPANLPGVYRYIVEIDNSTSSDCGDILESNEKNNRLEGSWNLCPDPAFSSGDLVALGRVQRGQETTFVATVRNRGRLSINRDFPVHLGTRDGELVNLSESTVMVEASCDAPIEPGDTYQVSWPVTLSTLDPVDILVATAAPNRAMPEECSSANNQTRRFLFFDVSPWTSWQNMNFNTIRDISSSAFPRWGEVANASYAVRSHRPQPGASNSRRERISSPISVYPSTGEMVVSYLFDRSRGPDEIFGTRPLDALASQYPIRYPLPVDFGQNYCNPDNPVNAVKVFVDHERLVTESSEANQFTMRALPDLRVTSVTRSRVLNDRLLLTYGVARSLFKEFYIGEWNAVAELTAPTGEVRSIQLAPQTGPYQTCQSCQPQGSARDPIDHPEGIDVPHNGYYFMKVTADSARPEALCGDIPERDEKNNSKQVRWALCPELAITVQAEPPAPPAPGVASTAPWQVTVKIKNKGARDLVESIRVELVGLNDIGDRLPVEGFPAFEEVEFTRNSPLSFNETATLNFTWNSYASDSGITRLGALVTVLDTDADNGLYPDFALCSDVGGHTRLGSTPVCPSCLGLCPNCPPPPIVPPERGCLVEINPTTLEACGDETLSFTLTRPGSGNPIRDTEVDDIDAELVTIDADGYIDPIAPQFTYEGPGAWESTFPLPETALGSSMSLYLTLTLADGSVCFAQDAYLVEGSRPDLSLDPSNIEFTSLNYDGMPYTDALVDDIAEMRFSVTNGPNSCGVRNLVGRAYIDLDYSQIPLGNWTIDFIGQDETLPVNLFPLPNQPVQPIVQSDSSILWTVTAPSPWLHVVTLVLDLPDGTTLETSKVLNVGRYFGIGPPPDLPVTLVDPTPGPITPVTDQTFTFRVERNDPTIGIDPVSPEQLAQLKAVITDPTGQVLATYDMLASSADHLGGGEYIAHFDTTTLGVTDFTVTASARHLDGMTGLGSGDFIIDDPCLTDPNAGDTCVTCLDDDGDGHLGLTDACVEGTDCDDSNPKGTITYGDADCDGSETEDDCDDNDPTVSGPCPIDCTLVSGIDVALTSVDVVTADCLEDEPQFELVLANTGSLPVGPELNLAFFGTLPRPGVTPIAVVSLDDLVLLEGSLPLEPGATLTLLYETSGSIASALSGDVWVIANHGISTLFAVAGGTTTTSGEVAECVLDDNQLGPLACKSAPECQDDADCGAAADLCDIRMCADGICLDVDDGTTWSKCEDEDVFYVRITRGNEEGYIACRPSPDDDAAADCERDEDGVPVIHAQPIDIYCAEGE